MRGKGKGHRFDYLFRRLDEITSELTKDIDSEEAYNKLVSLHREASEKACFSDYEEHDRLNILNTCNWWFRAIKNW